MEERDLSGLRAYAQSLSGQFQEIRRQLSTMQEELNAISATAKSPDGFVTATVGPRGQLIKLHLDPRVYRSPDSARLATVITETIHAATRDAAAKVDTIAAKHAPGVDAGSYLRGDPISRFNRFDFVFDQIEGADR